VHGPGVRSGAGVSKQYHMWANGEPDC
jgi:hypothetical protein